MANQIKVGHFQADAGIVYLPLGFVPDYFKMIDLNGASTISYEWFERQQDDEAGGEQEGIQEAANGAKTLLGDAAGITAYDTGAQIPTVLDWSAGLTVVARSASAHGTYIRPTASSEEDRNAIFEVVTNVTTGTTEPTWTNAPAIGDQILDNHGSPVVYERVNVALERGGYQGVCIQNEIQGSDREYYFLAIQADESEDLGDVEGWIGGVRGA